MRKKKERFSDNINNRNVIEEGKKIFEEIKGNWRSKYFQNDNDIILELACGRGEYSTGLGAIYKNKNFIGIDIKGNRIWVGSKKAERDNQDNVAFLRTQIDHLDVFFRPGEINEIWIVFPDPRQKGRDKHRRLTSPKYLDVYKNIIIPGGVIHLKTDSLDLFEFTRETLNNRNDIQDVAFTRDLYHSEFAEGHHGIITKYEQKFTAQGRDIKYLKFSFS